MKTCHVVCLLAVLSTCVSLGCGSSDGPTVIQPTETYELTDQEQQNRERAKKALAEQRQQ